MPRALRLDQNSSSESDYFLVFILEYDPIKISKILVSPSTHS